MKKICLFVVFIMASAVSAEINYSYVIGDFGLYGSPTISENANLSFSLFQNYIIESKSGLVFMFSPFYSDKPFYSNSFDYSIINASLCYSPFADTQYVICGPYIDFKWRGFRDNGLDVITGVKIAFTERNDSYLFSFGEKQKNKYIELALGYRYFDNTSDFFIGFTLDWSLIFPLLEFTSYRTKLNEKEAETEL